MKKNEKENKKKYKMKYRREEREKERMIKAIRTSRDKTIHLMTTLGPHAFKAD